MIILIVDYFLTHQMVPFSQVGRICWFCAQNIHIASNGNSHKQKGVAYRSKVNTQAQTDG